ncbi:hypothetical protein NMB32_20750 [Stenotrophomonas sp. CD2]|nr:hypothetical protein NMB32_20750 [Stenotrophomonas sp. CD2]
MSDEFNPMLPPLDDAKAEEMIGKVVLVGVTRYGGDGQVQGLEQYAGTVLRISADEGVVLADEDDGHERYLPPMLDQYQRAEPGEYRMRNSGMIVVDPDYLTAGTCTPSSDDRPRLAEAGPSPASPRASHFAPSGH